MRNSWWGFCYLGDKKLVGQEISSRYRDVARIFGFMYSIAKDESLFALRAINKKALSGRGHNSPATGDFVHEYRLVRFSKGKYNSPYKIEKMIWATVKKAYTKHKIKISFEMALSALGITKNTSKAATVATYKKLGLERDFGTCKSFRQGREALTVYYIAKAKAKAKGLTSFILKNETKEFRFSYRMDGSYSVVDSKGTDLYKERIILEGHTPEELVKYSPLLKGELEKMTETDWELTLKSKPRQLAQGTLVKIKTLTGVWYTLNGKITARTLRDCIKSYEIELETQEEIAKLGKEALASNRYLFIEDSYTVKNCIEGTKQFMSSLGIPSEALTIPIRKIWKLATERDMVNEHFRNAVVFALNAEI